MAASGEFVEHTTKYSDLNFGDGPGDFRYHELNPDGTYECNEQTWGEHATDCYKIKGTYSINGDIITFRSQKHKSSYADQRGPHDATASETDLVVETRYMLSQDRSVIVSIANPDCTMTRSSQ